MSGIRAVKDLRLYHLKKTGIFDKDIGCDMPAAYRKFWKEWKMQPSAVHYIENPAKYVRKEETGEVFPVQNVRIPLKFPKEHNEGIWGGEGIIKGFQKRHFSKRRVPHFWFPVLKKSVVYSEVLNKYMSIVVTQRTIDLIHENYGFDHYLLKTLACDLKSQLALKLKREILKTLSNKSLYPDDPAKRDEVYAKYEQYLSAYTPEEIEWYGLNWFEACKKITDIKEAAIVITPLKQQYRAELIAQLKEAEKEELENGEASVSWLSKLNPLSKSSKTP